VVSALHTDRAARREVRAMELKAGWSGIAAVVGVMFALGASATPASAAAGRRRTARAEASACATTRDRARERMQSGRLREAQELYLACARLSCGEVVRQDCLARHTQLAGDIPSIVPLVTDSAGAPHVLVEVRIDGQLVTSRLSGQALLVDPGKHELSFSTDEGVFATRQVFVAQGERNRLLHIVLHASEPAAMVKAAGAEPAQGGRKAPDKAAKKDSDGAEASEQDELGAPKLPAARAPAPRLLDAEPHGVVESRPAAARGAPASAYVLGLLGAVGVGGFALLTSWGRADNRLLAGCSPTCPEASVQRVRRLYWTADASLGVGLVSLAASTWLFAGSF
jgi:hypothetical protein